MQSTKRREFLFFLGKSSIVGVGIGFVPLSVFNSCKIGKNNKLSIGSDVFPSLADELVLHEGLSYNLICSWGDYISDDDFFGYNNDYTAYISLGEGDGLLWVNHEYHKSMFVSNFEEGIKTLEQIDKELYSVGGSILRVKIDDAGKWKMQSGDKYNRRITGHTPIPFHWDEKIFGASEALGTLGNCSGGITPWGTILTCEENYDSFYGEITYQKGERVHQKGRQQFERHYDRPPEHYGWVVEVDPKTGSSRKLVALGRFMHECATIHEAEDGRLVIYSGDDAVNQCLYKYIASKPGDLKNGKLYVADLVNGKWLSLDINDNPKLKNNFKNQTDIQIRTREAAKLVGGTPLDRPEDIEIDPITGHVFVSLTNNFPKGNKHGSILKIIEEDNDMFGLSFHHESFLTGGKETGFACPDNMAFDQKGNLWFTTDMSGRLIDKEPYEGLGNNGLFLFLRSGDQAGQLMQVASAPIDAELTGPFFSPDGKTLFLSVQHPGECSDSLDELTSNWPDGGNAIPRPSVVAIQGPFLDTLV